MPEAQKLIQDLLARGHTMEGLARLVGCGPRSLYRWRDGKRALRPYHERLAVLAEASSGMGRAA